MGTGEGQLAHKDLIVWQKSMAFANAVIDLVEQLETGRNHFRLIEQLESASTSIAMNIAEGMRSTLMMRVGILKKNSCIFFILPEDLSMRL